MEPLATLPVLDGLDFLHSLLFVSLSEINLEVRDILSLYIFLRRRIHDGHGTHSMVSWILHWDYGSKEARQKKWLRLEIILGTNVIYLATKRAPSIWCETSGRHGTKVTEKLVGLRLCTVFKYYLTEFWCKSYWQECYMATYWWCLANSFSRR